ncbi:hypothetical protein, partial [Propylenella binzhouense]
MTPSAPPLVVVSSQPRGPVAALHRYVGQREGLRAGFRLHWQELAPRLADDELDAWCEAALALVNVNAGPTCLDAFARLSTELVPAHGLPSALRSAHAAAEICRRSGSHPAARCLEAGLVAARRLKSGAEIDRWWGGLRLLARLAPESVAPLAERMEAVLARCDGRRFESFVHAGLKAGGRDRVRRQAFFSLEEPLARQLLERDWDAVSFDDVESSLKAFATALWGQAPALRALEGTGLALPRRTSIAGGIVRVPAVYRGFAAEAARPLFRAAIAHATAHFAFGAVRFPAGSLKPLQIALVTLVEDARVEALAMRRFPGLRALWAPYHTAGPSGATTAPVLLARLARALFDPDYGDGHGFVVKGRALFDAERENLADASISRRIGGLLGNDLGQMRIQFNAKSYVVEPVYRDDGYGIWDFGEDGEAAPEQLEIFVDAAKRIEEERPEETEPDRRDGEPDEAEAGHARAAPPDERGIAIARYPEWDRGAGLERADWTTIRDMAPAAGDPRRLEAALDREPDVRARLARL